MAIRNICIYGNEVLRKKTKFIKTFDQRLQKLVEEMFETMYLSNGIGLAAPQVGLLKKLLVVDTLEPGGKIALANPKILWESEETWEMNEGCLSIPGLEGEVERSEKIRVKANDPFTGDEIEFEAEGLFARVILHENDHLNGVLFVDHLTPAERAALERKLQELAAA
ncbi:MAG: peptide deformylase [Candidatus Hinthialibacter antarcticus]|nr:peptide deformylase [Candidatus Hinthialibacter antarcticus]